MDGLSRYLVLGAASGLRTMAGPARLSRHLADRDPGPPMGTLPALFGRAPVRALLELAAAGEMIADKLPGIPDRIDPAPLLGRAAMGALAGAALARLRGDFVGAGALLGGIGAVGGAYAGFHARRALTRGAGLPDLPVALCEDAAAIGLAGHALRD